MWDCKVFDILFYSKKKNFLVSLYHCNMSMTNTKEYTLTPDQISANNTTRNIFYLCISLVVIGALNWGLYAISKDYDLVAALLGEYSYGARFVYLLVGLSGLWVIISSIANSSVIYATD